jgi:hypothetical protein
MGQMGYFPLHEEVGDSSVVVCIQYGVWSQYRHTSIQVFLYCIPLQGTEGREYTELKEKK